MRTARIKEDGAAYYHVISRIVDRQRCLDDSEKERFRELLHQTAGFSGIEILAWTALSNHWHALLYVPARGDVSDALLLERLGYLYHPLQVRHVAADLQALRAEGEAETAERLKARYTRRMYDVSEFAKTLKQRFSQSYNLRHGRSGPLWDDRFKSVLLGGSGNALSIVATYIELNCVRAGMVTDPKDYRFCSYAEALGGSALAREGIRKVISAHGEVSGWVAAAARYRQLIYVRGEAAPVADGAPASRPGFSPATVQAVMAEGGTLSLAAVLRCRVGYFTDGLVLGSRNFVEDVLARHRARLARKRQIVLRAMAGGDWGGLQVLRHPRRAPITILRPS